MSNQQAGSSNLPRMEQANLLPFVEPAAGESLVELLARAAAAHQWPAGALADDLALLEGLLRDTAEDARAPELASHLVRALSFAADPSMALRHFERYIRSHGSGARVLAELRHNTEHLHFLCSLFSFSNYLSEIAIARTEYLDWLFRKGRLNTEKSLCLYRDEIAEWLGGEEHFERRREMLTLYKKRELLRIGVRDLMERGNTQELCRELSHLAEAIIEVVTADVLARTRRQYGTPMGESTGEESGFCVYAMGKFGAGELNFSSDVDLIFVYDEEGETSGVSGGLSESYIRRISNHEFFSKVSTEISSFLSNSSREGFLFRVDTRLRPEGIDGPIARSRGAYSLYLTTQAGLWEKISYLKARLCAGDAKVGAVMDSIIQQFVFFGNDASILFPEIARLKRRIDFDSLNEETRELDIKRGRGGIREIEFVVAGLQLVHADVHPELRIRPTLVALDILVAKGLFDGEEAARLRRAYYLYRRIEHTLQMMNEAQVHRMPSGARDRAALALRCGFLVPDAFERLLEQERQFVRGVFQRVFAVEDAPARLTLEDYLFGEQSPPPAIMEELRPMGLATPEGFAALRSLAVGTSEFAPSTRGRLGFQRLLPLILNELPLVALPHQAVRQFDLLLRASRGFTWVYELCLSHPLMLKMFLRTLGFGSMLARLLISHPEWLDEIFSSGGLAESRTRMRIDETDLEFPGHDLAGAFTRLRQFKALEAFLVSVQEVLAITPFDIAARRTSLIADAVLEGAAAIALREVAPNAPPIRWAILGLGGLGDRQVHFHGDLDIAIVVEDDPARADIIEHMARILVQHVSAHTPDGQLWKLDARLRPDGASGLLIATRTRFLEYYRTSAGPWEWQVLTKARTVAGDAAFGEALLGCLYAEAPALLAPIDLRREITAMRGRIDNSFKLPRSASADLKRGPGGVIDVEFLVQYLQLSHADEAAEFFPLTTEQALVEFGQRGVLPPDDAEFLHAHLRRLRMVQRGLRLMLETTSDFLPADEEKLAALDRGLADQTILNGLDGPRGLADAMRECRRRFDRLMAPP